MKFFRNNVVTGKTSVFYFVLPILFTSTLASDREILCENDVFSILVRQLKRVLQFFEKRFHFLKHLFQNYSIENIQSSL